MPKKWWYRKLDWNSRDKRATEHVLARRAGKNLYPIHDSNDQIGYRERNRLMLDSLPAQFHRFSNYSRK